MNEVLIHALRENQVEVVECHQDLWKGGAEKVESLRKGLPFLLRLAWRLSWTYLALAVRFFRTGPYDLLIVGYPGHLDFFWAKILNLLHRRRPLVVNLLFSLHDTVVNDRRLIPPDSPRARLLHEIDGGICQWADRVILDTEAHIRYFQGRFGIPREKFVRIPVGADDTRFRPAPPAAPVSSGPVRVLWFGTYIPLHGIETILRAAHELRDDTDIRFLLIGSGQIYPEMTVLARTLGLTGVAFLSDWQTSEALARHIREADICLGIFGTTEKALRVIPCKVYNCLAMGKPVITADTPAARELLTPGLHADLTPPGDPQALAEAIRRLKKDPARRERLGKGGYDLFLSTLSPKKIGEDLKRNLEGLTFSR